ncbi:MAG: glycerophosphodiester phosphodiesterase [Lentisphaeria bacterium]|jgi:glycerophosphoryl diester phosphodiesterase|nr:glycerophosphodiester phosphodiesterase [Lentisphaeria bacterium]
MSFLHNGVTAHRGNPAEFPENTLPGFRSGIELGADWLELDVHLTRDGELVVCHDHTTGRTADRHLVIAETTWAELRGLAFGIPACPARMPLLREVIELVQSQRRTRLSIQPKADCVAETAALVRRLGAEEWIGFNDGDARKLAQARELLPDAWIFLDTPPGLADVQPVLACARTHRFQAVVMHHSTVTPERVASLVAAGLEVGAWTVNEPAAMRAMLQAGVTRLYTDFPRRFLDLLNKG